MPTFKQKFKQQVSGLALRCASDGATSRHLISQELHDALAEIEAELRKPRSNWRLIAALCGVKSFIAGKAKRLDGGKNHFWSKIKGENGPYSVLDRLAHEAAYHSNVVPAGGIEYTATPTGIRKRELDISGESPTLTLMRKERDWIAEHA